MTVGGFNRLENGFLFLWDWLYTVWVPMDDFAKMDVFFLVTTVAVIVLAILVGVLLFYILRTARDVSEVVHVVRNESEQFVKGVSSARRRIRGHGESMVQNVIAFVQSFAPTKKHGQNKDTK